MRGRRIVVVEPPKPKPKPVAAKPAAKPWPAPPRARVPANQLQREQAQLEAEFESLSDAARTVEARTEDVSRLAAQFATLVDEQHDQVVTLDGLVGDTANQVDKAGDHVAQAASRRATLPRVFNAVVLSLAALLLLIHAVHS
jgi:ABC-type transporter Mla subunit MlaD